MLHLSDPQDASNFCNVALQIDGDGEGDELEVMGYSCKGSVYGSAKAVLSQGKVGSNDFELVLKGV